MDIKARKHIWGMAYCMLILGWLLVWLLTSVEYTTGWYIAFVCIVGAIIVGIADICFVYANHLINKLED